MLSGSTWVYGLVSKLGCLVSPCWGESGSFWFLPIGGEGGRFGYSPLGSCSFHWAAWFQLLLSRLWSSRWGSLFHVTPPLGERVGEMVMVFLLGKLVSWCCPMGERVGHMITPHWGRGLTICKANSCFVCLFCCVGFHWPIFVCPVVVAFNFSLFYYLFQFVFVVSQIVAFSVFI